MNKRKWYRNVPKVLLIIVLLPVIIIGLVVSVPYIMLHWLESKKDYKKSRYYTDFKQKFMMSIALSPEYRFYNSAMRRNLNMKYVRQETNGFEYFIYDGTVYIFPDFEQIDFIKDESEWQVNYDGDWKSFDECYNNLLAKLENSPECPVKLLVEKIMFSVSSFDDVDIPDCIFVTWNYENAFENEDSPFKMVVPKSSKELYDMMCQTPDLCGNFELDEDTGYIVWNLYENIRIGIDVYGTDCCFDVSRVVFGKVKNSITHWHPDVLEIYDEVCNVGKRGNVMVLCSSPVRGSTELYCGRKEACPYKQNKKSLFRKYYYLEAR